MFAPLKIFESPYSVVLLNHGGDFSKPEEFCQIWNNAARRVCVDGGTNSWYTLYVKDEKKVKQPNIVSGDFDSIDPQVLQYVRGLEKCNPIKVIHTPDQDETDFTKGLKLLLSDPAAPRTVLVLTPDRSVRFDHLIAGLNTLIKSLTMDAQIYLYDYGNVIFAIPPGTDTKEVEILEQITCGIIPIDGPAIIKTDGLKWDLDGFYGFGGMVSTSNETVKKVVHITTNRVLIFSAVLGSILNVKHFDGN